MKYIAKGTDTHITHGITWPLFFSPVFTTPTEAAALCVTYTWITDASGISLKLSLFLGNAYFAIPSEKKKKPARYMTVRKGIFTRLKSFNDCILFKEPENGFAELNQKSLQSDTCLQYGPLNGPAYAFTLIIVFIRDFRRTEWSHRTSSWISSRKKSFSAPEGLSDVSGQHPQLPRAFRAGGFCQQLAVTLPTLPISDLLALLPISFPFFLLLRFISSVKGL